MKSIKSIAGRFVKAAVTILFAGIVATPSQAEFLEFREGVSPSGSYDVEDSDIRDSAPTVNQEGNPRWNFGIFNGINYREVAGFDISALPGGIIVTSVTLTVYQSASGSAGTQTAVALHSITNSNFNNETNATWNYASTAAFPWANPGGDFDSTVLSSITPIGIVDGTAYTFGSSAAFITAVNNALAGDGVMRLLAKASTESEGSLMSMWASDSGPVEGLRPLLRIDYIPEPTTALLMLGSAMLLWRRRSRG